MLLALSAQNDRLRAQVERLTARVEKLERELAKNSRNSSLPPSTDPPGSTPEVSRPSWKFAAAVL